VQAWPTPASAGMGTCSHRQAVEWARPPGFAHNLSSDPGKAEDLSTRARLSHLEVTRLAGSLGCMHNQTTECDSG
jgi:hypothetical protein